MKLFLILYFKKITISILSYFLNIYNTSSHNKVTRQNFQTVHNHTDIWNFNSVFLNAWTFICTNHALRRWPAIHSCVGMYHRSCVTPSCKIISNEVCINDGYDGNWRTAAIGITVSAVAISAQSAHSAKGSSYFIEIVGSLSQFLE